MAEPVEDEEDMDEEETPVPVHAGLLINAFSMNLPAQVCV